MFDGLPQQRPRSAVLMTKLIEHRGVRVTPDWPAKISAAQVLTHYTRSGVRYPRIPFGSDNPAWGEKPCRDCGVFKGEFHVPDCEYEHCPCCGQGLIQTCECLLEELAEDDKEPPVSRAQVAFWMFLAAVGVAFAIFLVWAV